MVVVLATPKTTSFITTQQSACQISALS